MKTNNKTEDCTHAPSVRLNCWLGRAFLLFTVLLFVGCEQVIVRKIIPPRNAEAAQKYVTEQMNTIKITSRNDDENFDDFLAQANKNALEIYGIDTIGIWDGWKSNYTPYALCTKEQKAELDLHYTKSVP